MSHSYCYVFSIVLMLFWAGAALARFIATPVLRLVFARAVCWPQIYLRQAWIGWWTGGLFTNADRTYDTTAVVRRGSQLRYDLFTKLVASVDHDTIVR